MTCDLPAAPWISSGPGDNQTAYRRRSGCRDQSFAPVWMTSRDCKTQLSDGPTSPLQVPRSPAPSPPLGEGAWGVGG